MSWAQELKDFTSGFSTGMKLGQSWEKASNDRADREAKQKEKDDLEKAGNEGVAAAQTRASSGTPGESSSSGGGTQAGNPNEVSTKFLSSVQNSGLDNPFALATLNAYGQAESGWSPKLLTSEWNDVGKPSGGALSWRDDRLRNLRKEANWQTPEGQGAFFVKEAQQTGLWDKLKNAKSLDEANAAMAEHWRFKNYKNRGQGSEYARRLGLSQSYFDRSRDGTRGVPAPTPVTSQPLPAPRAMQPVAYNEEEEEQPTVYAASGGYVDPEKVDEVKAAVPTETTSTVEPSPRPTPRAAVRTEASPPSASASASPQAEDVGNSPSGGSGGAGVRLLFSKEELTNMDTAADATAAGLKYIQSMFTSGAGVPDQARDRAQRIGSFARNEDVPTPQDVAEVDKIIDPKGELSPDVKGIARLNGMYEYYMRKGDADKASKTAAAMLMYTRSAIMKGGAHIQALIEKGNLDGAAKVAKQVSQMTPDGKTLDVQATPQGDFKYKVIDENGKLTAGGRLAVNEVLRLAAGWQDGSSWFEEMAGMAGRSRGRGTGTGRERAPPRGTAAERKAAAEADAAKQGEAQRAGEVQQKAGELGVGQAPGIPMTPSPDTPAPGAAETTTRQGVPTGVTPDLTPSASPSAGVVPNSVPSAGGTEAGQTPALSRSDFEPGQTSYSAPTGPRRVAPEEAQTSPGASAAETMAGGIATAGERERKVGELRQGVSNDAMLRSADQAYAAATNRKGVRSTDSNRSREDVASGVETGFNGVVYGGREQKEGESAIPKDRRPVFNGIATKMLKANEGMTSEDAGRMLGQMMTGGLRLNRDGTVVATDASGKPIEGAPSIVLDSKSIKQIDTLRGGKRPSVKGTDTSVTPRTYSMPEERRPTAASPEDVAAGEHMREQQERPTIGGRGSYPQGNSDTRPEVDPERIGRAMSEARTAISSTAPPNPEIERELEVSRGQRRAQQSFAAGPEADRGREMERERDRPLREAAVNDPGIIAAIKDGVSRYVDQALGRLPSVNQLDQRSTARSRAVETRGDSGPSNRRLAVDLGPVENDRRTAAREEYSKRR